MKITIAQGSTVIVEHGTPEQETYVAGQMVDVEEAVGDALVRGGSAMLTSESRADALTQ